MSGLVHSDGDLRCLGGSMETLKKMRKAANDLATDLTWTIEDEKRCSMMSYICIFVPLSHVRGEI